MQPKKRQNCTQSTYQRDGKTLGRGTFGTIFSATNTLDHSKVAIKEIHAHSSEQSRCGASWTALREITLLKRIQHCPHVITLVSVFFSNHRLNLVFELCTSDLDQLFHTHTNEDVSQEQVVLYLQGALSALRCCHQLGILHRDVKPANLLLSHCAGIKLGDFGSATQVVQDRELTAMAGTLYYRAPEMLFGAKHYGPEVDMWALGLTFLEAQCRGSGAVLQGRNEMDQLSKIVSWMGAPGPGLDHLPYFMPFPKVGETVLLTQRFPENTALISLLEKMVVLNPLARIQTKEALQHDIFSHCVPLPPS